MNARKNALNYNGVDDKCAENSFNFVAYLKLIN